MGFLARLPGLLLSPRATWAAIAAEPPPRLARSLLTLAAGAALVNLAVAMTRPNGWFTATHTSTGGLGPHGGVAAGSSTTLHLGLAPLAISYILLMLLGVLLLRRLIQRRAVLYGAAQDAAAAQKLAVYAPLAMWIALFLLPLGQNWLMPLAGLHGLAMLSIGAPILLPPSPGEERRWGRAVAFRALLIAFGMLLLQLAAYMIVAALWGLSTAMRSLPSPGLHT